MQNPSRTRARRTALTNEKLAAEKPSTGWSPALPLVPEVTLRSHHVQVSSDNRFRSAARLMQALWREDNAIPIGMLPASDRTQYTLGSSIAFDAGLGGANFIHPNIAKLVRRELVYREIGAVYDDVRLYCNLLSSQPLAFNIFGPLKLDLDYAQAVAHELAPDYLSVVSGVLFEHSPGRNSKTYTGDNTAFDVVLVGEGPEGQRRFLSVEMKYTEDGNEPLPRFSGRYEEIARQSDLFTDPDDPVLFCNPVQQLFRQLCLGQTMLDAEVYDEGLHVIISPAYNFPARNAARAFAGQLKNAESSRLGFKAVTLEGCIEAIINAGGSQHARALLDRYCQWDRLHRQLDIPEVSSCDDDGFLITPPRVEPSEQVQQAA